MTRSEIASRTLAEVLRESAKVFRPREKLGTTAWAEKYRFMSAKSTALPGRYSAAFTPWINGMHEALDDPKIHRVVALKSAQVGWTDGVILNYLGKRIDIDPCPMIVMFAKEGAARQFSNEKLTPMIEVTPRLVEKIPIYSKRDKSNQWDFKGFPGGFLKLVGSNSAASVKSTPAMVVAIEEPDDCNENISDQGDTIALLEERTKTFHRRKVIFGGTPTVAGVSRIDAAYNASDKRKFFVPCPSCGVFQELIWENVKWKETEGVRHEVFGNVDLSSVRYECPHCHEQWTEAQKNAAVRKGEWRATAPFTDTAGFYINEIYSPFPGSTMRIIVEKYLRANAKMQTGDDSAMRAFYNSQLGRAYEYASDLPDSEALAERAIDYAEFTVPVDGVILTAGVDVQHDRLAVVIRAWGQDEESWLVYWGEIPGNTMQPEIWKDLDALFERTVRTKSGAKLTVKAVSIDSSDGRTNDAVYSYVRRHKQHHYMAIKGASSQTDAREIFTTPKPSVDVNHQNKASRYGLKPYIVGVNRAKDLILGFEGAGGRIKLEGNGPGRMHNYSAVRSDYYEQLTSEVKVPTRGGFKRVWQKKSGCRNEALDCEVYALHAARSLKLHLKSHEGWKKILNEQIQGDLFSQMEAENTKEEEIGQQEELIVAQNVEEQTDPFAGTYASGWTKN